jgi:dephospho-CoA kinase
VFQSSTRTSWRATWSSPDNRRSSGSWSVLVLRSSRRTATWTGPHCGTSCSPKARADLEALTHPAIGAATEARSAEAGGIYQVLVIPLLVEKSLGSQLDRVVVVDCDEELQIRRLQARDGSTLEQARAILNAQTSRAARLKAAHDVIKNEGDMSAVRDQVEKLHPRYLELAQQAQP